MDSVPVSLNAGMADGEEMCGSKKPNGGKENERYFNETVIRGRCSFRTSDKKMEP